MGITTLLLLVEVSTVFLNYRAMFPKEEFGNAVPQALQLLFFICFTVFRMILMPYGIILLWRNYNFVFHNMSIMRRVASYIAISEFILLYLLNFYWYMLILKGMAKMLGCIKKSDKFVKMDDQTRDTSD